MRSPSSESKSKSGARSILGLRLSSSTLFFSAFTAVFAVLAAYVFWGTWSPAVAPVMPDCPVWHPIPQSGQLTLWFRNWLHSGSFIPTDLFFGDGFISGYWTQEFKYALALYLAGLGLAYFLRGRGLSRVASYGAGLLLGFCGYWSTLFSAGHAGWFIWMSYGVFAFGLVDRALAGGSWRTWFLLGAVVAWGSFCQPDLWLLFTLFTGVYFIYRAIRLRALAEAPRWSSWGKGVAVAAVALFAIGIPSFKNALTGTLAGREKQIEESAGTSLTGGKDKNDAEGRWIFVTNWSMPPEDTLEFFIPRIHGDTSCPMTLQCGRAAGKDVRPYTGRLGRPVNASTGNYRQHSLYVGWVTCLLALIAIVFCAVRLKKHPLSTSTSNLNLSVADILFFAISALVLWLFSMGRFCEPVYRVIYLLPFGDSIRCPVKWHHLTEFCLCVLAGYGIESLLSVVRVTHAHASPSWLPSKASRPSVVRVTHAHASPSWLPSKASRPSVVRVTHAHASPQATKIAKIAVVAFVLFGAYDLARNDKVFCAPIDLGIVYNRNAAADDCVRLGKGTVADLLEGGRGLLGWSFAARGIGMNADPNATDTRFVLAGNEQVRRTPQLAAWLKAKTTLVGSYVLTQKGIRAAAPANANVSLYQVKNVPPPPEPETPSFDGLAFALGLLSLAGTLTALLFPVVRVTHAHIPVKACA